MFLFYWGLCQVCSTLSFKEIHSTGFPLNETYSFEVTNTLHINLSWWHLKLQLKIELRLGSDFVSVPFQCPLEKWEHLISQNVKGFTQLLIVLESNFHCTRVGFVEYLNPIRVGGDKWRVWTKTKIRIWFSLKMRKSNKCHWWI